MATLLERHVLAMLRTGRARTQAELCALAQQNSSTISELLRRLRRRGLIETAGMHRTGRGRPTAILRFNPGGYAAAIDLDGAHALVGILDFDGRVLTSKLIGFEPRAVSAESVLRECNGALRDLLRVSRSPRTRVRGLGIGINGQVSSAGVLEFSTVLPWRNEPIAALARSCFSLPTVVTGREQCAVGEYRYGAGQGSRCMLHFNVADGVSARPVVDGELFSGGTGNGGQIGHIVVRPGGPLCGCGQQGCLEALISGPAICYRIVQDANSRRVGNQAPPPSLADAAKRHAAVATVQELVRLSDTGESPYVQKLVNQVVDLAGQGLAIAIACFAPDLVVVDGYVFRGRLELIRRVAAGARARLGPAAVPQWPQIVSSQLGDDARLMSLVAVVADELVDSGEVAG
jgi:glucokinase